MVKNLWQTGQQFFVHQQSSILSAALVITITTLGSSVLGFIKNRLLIAYFFGSVVKQQQLDAYWVAFRLPDFVFQLLVIGALSAAFIPVYAKYLKKNREEADMMASSVMNIVLIIFAGLSLAIFIFARQFTGLITSPNFSREQIILAAQLTKIMLLAQFFFAVSNFFTGMIQVDKRFLVPALAPVVYNLGIIIGIVGLTPILGIYGPAVGVVIGALLHLLLQAPLAKILGFKYTPTINFGHPGVREMFRLMPPRILTISVGQIELFATVFFATALAPGSLTIMNIATQLISAPIRIFSMPISQASLPFLSHTAADGELTEFKQTFIQSLHQILFIAFPAGMLLLILRIPLVRLVYGAADFPWSATLLTGKVVAILALSIFAEASIHILSRSFYALQNTKLPLVIALVAVSLNVVVAYLSVYVYAWGVLGLATGFALSAVLEMSLLAGFLMKKVGTISAPELLLSPIKMMFASGAMALSLWMPMRLLDRYVFDTTRVVPLIILTVIVSFIGGGVYLLLSLWLKVPEISSFLRLFKRLGNWRQVLSQSNEVLEEPV